MGSTFIPMFMNDGLDKLQILGIYFLVSDDYRFHKIYCITDKIK